LCFPEGQEHLAALSKAKLVIISQEMLLQVITRLQTKANTLLRDNAAGVPGQGERHMCRGVLWEAICHLRFLGEQKHLVSPQVKKFRDHESDPISNTEMEAFCYDGELLVLLASEGSRAIMHRADVPQLINDLQY